MKQNISTRHLKLLPSISQLKKVSQSIAMLDAIIEPEWDFRYYSFNSKWSIDEQMASMRDGCGDSYFILFKPIGAIIKGYAHTSLMGEYAAKHGHPWPRVLDSVPSEFSDFLSEPAFSIEETSFCIWRKSEENHWNVGDITLPKNDVDNVNFPQNEDPDCSAHLLFILDGTPQTYQTWGEKYYERDIKLDVVKSIYRHDPLSVSHVAELNPDIKLEDLEDDITEIGYP